VSGEWVMGLDGAVEEEEMKEVEEHHQGAAGSLLLDLPVGDYTVAELGYLQAVKQSLEEELQRARAQGVMQQVQ
jgi:hypothetical protein